MSHRVSLRPAHARGRLRRMRLRRRCFASLRDRTIGAWMPEQVHIIGGGLAGSEAAWQLAQAGVKVRLSEMRGGGEMTPAHQTRRAGRAGLLEQLPVGRCREQCGRPASRRDAGARFADPGCRRRAPRSRRLGAGRRPRGFRGRGHAKDPGSSQHRGRARAGRRPPRLRPHHRRDRSADRAVAGGIDPRRHRVRRTGLLRRDRADRPSRHDRHGHLPGSSRAGTRAAARITSTARSTGTSISPSTRDCSTARKASSASGRRTRPISRAACRSR